MFAALVTLRSSKLPLVFVMMLFGAIAGMAADGARLSSDTSISEPVVAYDIPAQELDAALNAYVRMSGVQVFYETAVTTGRRSAELKGQFAPDDALRILLMGTGLVGRLTDVDAFSIVPVAAQYDAIPVAPYARDSRFVDALQANVAKALCGNSQTRPGNYKIAFELWIGHAGNVQSSALVGSTGDQLRDAALIRALQDVRVDQPLPIGMPQPIILSVRPRTSSDNRDCAAR